MKVAVVTIAVGDIYKKISNLTHPLLKKYADKIKADFIVINESSLSSPHWEKFNKIYTLLNDYERIIYLDSDIIVRDDCPNLFNIVPKSEIGLFNEAPFTSQRHLSLIDSCKAYDIKLKNWNGRYYNTGVMVVSRCHKQLFKKPEKEIFSFYEQGYFNAILSQKLEEAGNELAVFELPYDFNRMTCMDQFIGIHRLASYIVHYAGYPSLEFVLNLINADISKLELLNSRFDFKRNILIEVQGGLGDQICAEPVVRFMKKYVYKLDNITLLTHFPEVFEHLKLQDIKVFKYGEFKREFDTPYYNVVSLPGPETIMWSCVSNLLCHSVDFTSMALLRRTLPDIDKQPQLIYDSKDLAEVIEVTKGVNLEKLVLVHAGRHWESKTFPTEWWQKVIDKLDSEGLKVCLIGADEKTRGVIELKTSATMIDTRNLLSLKSLFALISKAKLLISNDSAPIHIAGAFDNNIILIPTCKHPDHILPYRKGNKYYKAVALYKKLMCFEYNSQPTSLYGVLADKTPGVYYDYLPNIKDVVDESLNIINGV